MGNFPFVMIPCLPHYACSSLSVGGAGYEFCNDFDLHKPAECSLFTGATIKCESLAGGVHVDSLLDHCKVFITNLAKSLLRVSNAVAIITFLATLLTPSMAIQWQHFADILISVEAVLDDNKEMAGMLMDYPDVLGFLHIHNLASINTQMVPAIPEAAMHAVKVVQRKKLVPEHLLFALVDATSGSSKNGGAAGPLCGRPANSSSPLDFLCYI
ncbi:unnamed protein product [Sphagnum troendelagicum]|uniref:Elongator complex protein 4 n=1 Tax=Sphagnum troendelagicum TaxID=128251 RepID=A0ABP0V3I5_9BRYO